jgi:hypothetical protein
VDHLGCFEGGTHVVGGSSAVSPRVSKQSIVIINVRCFIELRTDAYPRCMYGTVFDQSILL